MQVNPVQPLCRCSATVVKLSSCPQGETGDPVYRWSLGLGALIISALGGWKGVQGLRYRWLLAVVGTWGGGGGGGGESCENGGCEGGGCEGGG